MIKRYGTGISTMFDKRTIPLGNRRRNAQPKGVVELEGDITYGVSVLIGTDMVDTPLPSGWGGEGNISLATAEFCNLKDSSFLFAREQPFLILDDNTVWQEVSGGVVKVNPNDFEDPVADSVQKIDGDIAISAYGRLWVTGVNNDYHTIHYSSLLDETSWYDERIPPADEADAANYVPPYNVQNTGGLIDVREYWPVESDVIVNIHAHNGYLFVFGRNSILVYAGADAPDPAGENGIRLEDAISDVGLIRRDAICNIGTDIMFVDDSGVRSLGRVIQEKSNPLQEPSINIRREIQDVIAQELIEVPSHSAIKMEYLPSESIVVLLFASLRVAYVLILPPHPRPEG